MPIYEYRCLRCHKDFEKLVLNSQKEAVVCPSCHDPHVEKQMSTFGAKFSTKTPSFSSNSSSCASCSSKNCSTCR